MYSKKKKKKERERESGRKERHPKTSLTMIPRNTFRMQILLASERSELDTLRGNAIEISLYLFIYLSVYGVRETSVLARASNYVS